MPRELHHLDAHFGTVSSTVGLVNTGLELSNLGAESFNRGLGVAKLLGQGDEVGILERTLGALFISGILDGRVKCLGYLGHQI